MADEKLNVSPEENPQPSLFDAGPAGAPAPETSAPEPPAPENIPEQAAGDAPHKRELNEKLYKKVNIAEDL